MPGALSMLLVYDVVNTGTCRYAVFLCGVWGTLFGIGIAHGGMG